MTTTTQNQEQIQHECCICYETIGKSNMTITPCGHQFCFSCLMKSMDLRNTCPCCRAPLREEEDIIESDDDDDEEFSDSDSEHFSEDDDDNIDGHSIDRMVRATFWDNASNPSSEIATTTELEAIAKWCNISMTDLISMITYRYDEKYEVNIIQQKATMFYTHLRKLDNEKKKQWRERNEMMGEDGLRNNRITREMDIGDALYTMFQ